MILYCDTSAFSRRSREVKEDGTRIMQARKSLSLDWPLYITMEINQSLLELAGEYANTFALRGYDSIQLAAAAELARITDMEIMFACFDRRLNRAAKVLGLRLLSIGSSGIEGLYCAS
ncbi:MAG: type II toxin-antitoxin system VapC family toxin [Mariprofundales bacterium]